MLCLKGGQLRYIRWTLQQPTYRRSPYHHHLTNADVCEMFSLTMQAACGSPLTVGLYARLGQDVGPSVCANGAERAGEWCLAQRNLTNRFQELSLYTNLDPETGYRLAQYYFYGMDASGPGGAFWGGRADDPRTKWLNPTTGLACNATTARADCLPLMEVRAGIACGRLGSRVV